MKKKNPLNFLSMKSPQVIDSDQVPTQRMNTVANLSGTKQSKGRKVFLQLSALQEFAADTEFSDHKGKSSDIVPRLQLIFNGREGEQGNSMLPVTLALLIVIHCFYWSSNCQLAQVSCNMSV